MNCIMNHEVRGDILLRLEKLFNSVFDKKYIVSLCKKKWGKSHFNPFVLEVLTSVGHSINTQSGFFFQYLTREYIKNVKIEGSQKNRYELMPECKDGHTQLGINVMTMRAEVQNRSVPILFKDVLTDDVYYVQVCKDNHFEGDGKAIFVNRFISISDSLSKKYKNLHSLVVFIEEEKVEAFGVLSNEHLMTGRDFFDKFLGFPLETFYTLLAECKHIMRIDNRYVEVQNWVNRFVTYAERVGGEEAARTMLNTYKAANRSYIGF